MNRYGKTVVSCASFISCIKYFTLSGTGYQKNRHCVQENVNWQMKDAVSDTKKELSRNLACFIITLHFLK
ncbi:hypothetical protein MTBBW1_2130071 [Desulfamplus magnetovallimortis]|uniref:Uncharacterized protein n=1 Tax=Desulfamplus magnetovallimortis TaxID=1246637 RepID=A0A1W1HCL8_9BACT|nr:hypothetical protein MTBBW1_2130071 [Desulfamplus magnetovallimortis]